MADETCGSCTGIQSNNPRELLGSAALIGTGLVSLLSALSTSVLSIVLIIIVLLLALGK